MSSGGRYPFGRPVTPRPPTAREPRRLFVLGAYPSALHVEWTPPAAWRRVRALPVDDEPLPFWDGADQAARVDAWRSRVGFRAEWGTVRDLPTLNGPSGAWVRDNVLIVLGAMSADAWMTDCLDTYRASDGAAGRVADTYGPFARKLSIADAALLQHPSEDAIVEEALREHRARLLAELSACSPEMIVTLGNAALRVVREVIDDGYAVPERLRVNDYGASHAVRVAAHPVILTPLAHPASPARYQEAHAAWCAQRVR